MCWSLPLWTKGLLHLHVGERGLTVVCAYRPNSSSEYPPFLESLETVLESAPTGDSVIVLVYFNTHVGNDSNTWRDVIGRNGLPEPEPEWCSVFGFLC